MSMERAKRFDAPLQGKSRPGYINREPTISRAVTSRLFIYLIRCVNSLTHTKGFLLPVRHGEQHYGAKLTDKAVQQIRKTYQPGQVSYSQLAETYNVNKSTISRLLSGHTWKHLPATTGE